MNLIYSIWTLQYEWVIKFNWNAKYGHGSIQFKFVFNFLLLKLFFFTFTTTGWYDYLSFLYNFGFLFWYKLCVCVCVRIILLLFYENEFVWMIHNKLSVAIKCFYLKIHNNNYEEVRNKHCFVLAIWMKYQGLIRLIISRLWF